MKYCGHCGAPMEDHADVCVRCGTPFEDNVFARKEPDKKSGNWVLFAAVGFLILVGLIIAGYYFLEFSFYNRLLDF